MLQLKVVFPSQSVIPAAGDGCLIVHDQEYEGTAVCYQEWSVTIATKLETLIQTSVLAYELRIGSSLLRCMQTCASTTEDVNPMGVIAYIGRN